MKINHTRSAFRIGILRAHKGSKSANGSQRSFFLWSGINDITENVRAAKQSP